ncbi:MAG TPA: S49 family peptidase, partial [Gemmataceae bacterium]|nr:S49 family peptidase [Gemmataceae bacterium]
MRFVLPMLGLAVLSCGCDRFLVRTHNKVAIEGPVTTVVDIPPVSPTAGKLKPIVVQNGAAQARVAIVDVDGLILNAPFVGPLSVGENPVSVFREKLDAIECDPCVRGVVLRVHSPGGGVAACQAMRRDLERFRARTRKPVVACLLDLATGGAYYLASGCDSIVATPGTVTGGVGVLLNLFNLQDLMAQFNVIPQTIKAGPNTDIGTSSRPLSPEHKKLLQKMADEYHDQLKAEIRFSRPQIDALDATPTDDERWWWPPQKGTALDGRVFTANEAVTRGLVDRLGDLDGAIELAGQLGNAGPCRPQVVMYRRTNDPAHSIYSVTANVPLQAAGLFPSLPGLERTK